MVRYTHIYVRLLSSLSVVLYPGSRMVTNTPLFTFRILRLPIFDLSLYHALGDKIWGNVHFVGTLGVFNGGWGPKFPENTHLLGAYINI